MKQIIGALNTVMKSCGYVQKTGKNAFHGYKYAGEGDLLEKLRPAMVENGLILIPSVTEQSTIDEYGNTRVRVEYTLAHVSGEIWPHPIVAQGCGNDRNKNGVGDKGLYKAITGANKYLLFKLFQIETGDDPEATEQPAEPVKAAGQAPSTKPTASAAQPPASEPPSDWVTVANDIIAEARKARTGAQVDKILHDHKATLGKMPRAEFDRAKAEVTKHREHLAALQP